MENVKRRYCHIVVAGGSGSRFGNSVPKQFAQLGGKPVLMHSIERLRKWGGDGKVITAMSRSWRDYWLELCRSHGFDPGVMVDGGSTRWHSVKAALDLVDDDTDVVTVHDGARPLIDEGLMNRIFSAIESGEKGVVPVIGLRDSLRRTDGGGRSWSVARSEYRLVQTPQAFDRQALQAAYSRGYREDFTDDASVAESNGLSVATVEGDEKNIKITYPADILLAEYYLERERDGST